MPSWAPCLQNLASCSEWARWGNECILNESNPRMVCKDGTLGLVPIYFCSSVFYMPYLTPISEPQASGGYTPEQINIAMGLNCSHLMQLLINK